MSSSYVSNHVHIVFATKNRAPVITDGIQPKLWAYMAGIAENYKIHAVAIGGVEDHVHVLINLGAMLSISKAVQVVKSNSSRWMNEHRRTRFEWQEGYFATSVSRSQIPTVRRYISRQKEHHKRMSSEREFLVLQKKHGLEWHD